MYLSQSNYRFKMQRSSLTMPDGVRLACTIYMPYRKSEQERFPVLLEVLPYRKDDTFLLMDYPAYAYFARHGFITVKVDIRGTGGSEGRLPDREYSDCEIDDIIEVIRQLARHPRSNGKVGMFGVSWSGFNAIQTAMRNPDELKAILAMHASDDLYKDDLHYIDGVLHLDPYHLYINHENGLPTTPDYRLNGKFLKNRFNREPWLFTYLRRQKDGAFWSTKSLSRDYSQMKIPAYLIGGLMDGYRDTVVRMLENVSAPVKAEIGPWDHSCPDGDIGPQHEWQDEAIRWFEHYLKGFDNGIAEEVRERKLTVFVRSGHEPDPSLKDIPGKWRLESWPPRANITAKILYPHSTGDLLAASGKQVVTTLDYLPAAGASTGTWWGDTTGDMSVDDGRSLTFDTEPLQEDLIILGIPRVKLKVSAGATRANWTVRLEDVHPDGRVSLVTGALTNGRHFSGRLEPSDLIPDKFYEIELDLHFTTWTYKSGHRIRLAVGNAQFPLAWPSPCKMKSKLLTGSPKTALSLPVSVTGGEAPAPFRPLVEKAESKEGEYLELPGGRPDFRKIAIKDMLTGETSYEHYSNGAYRIKGRRFDVTARNIWKVHDREPAVASYEGTMTTVIRSNKRKLKLTTRIFVQSDQSFFHVRVTRTLHRNGKVYARADWQESIPRVNS